jgi:uncharacterized protein
MRHAPRKALSGRIRLAFDPLSAAFGRFAPARARRAARRRPASSGGLPRDRRGLNDGRPVFRNFGKTNLKLHQDSSGALNTVTGYGAHYVEINLERHEGSIIVLPDAPVIRWPVSSFDALTPELFELLIAPAPEVVVFGSGERLRFPHPHLTAALTARRIGVETMDFKAACRTYNILMAEGRKVAAALLIEG